MTNPQCENGYTKIANETLEALAKIRISGEEMQCLWVILRQTYGWNKITDRISFSQFSNKTGLPKPSVSRALKKLLTKKIIGIDKNVNGGTNLYNFNKHLREWKPLTKKLMPLTILSEAIDKDVKKPIDKSVKYKRNPLKKTLQKKGKPPAKDVVYSEEFLSFWEVYPNGKGKAKAFEAWEKIGVENGLIEIIMTAVEDNKKYNTQWSDPQFIPMPASWLNQRRWEDELKKVKKVETLNMLDEMENR